MDHKYVLRRDIFQSYLQQHNPVLTFIGDITALPTWIRLLLNELEVTTSNWGISELSEVLFLA